MRAGNAGCAALPRLRLRERPLPGLPARGRGLLVPAARAQAGDRQVPRGGARDRCRLLVRKRRLPRRSADRARPVGARRSLPSVRQRHHAAPRRLLRPDHERDRRVLGGLHPNPMGRADGDPHLRCAGSAPAGVRRLAVGGHFADPRVLRSRRRSGAVPTGRGEHPRSPERVGRAPVAGASRIPLPPRRRRLPADRTRRHRRPGGRDRHSEETSYRLAAEQHSFALHAPTRSARSSSMRRGRARGRPP